MFYSTRVTRVPFVSVKCDPPKASIDDADIIPEVSANWFSILTFAWIGPLLRLGYARPLEDSDLYRLQDSRDAAVIGNKIAASFDRRQKQAKEYNERLVNGEIQPALTKKIWWTLKGNRAKREQEWRDKDGRKSASLVLAMNDSVKWFFWSGGILKVIGDTAQVTSPLVVKVRLYLTFTCMHLSHPL